MAERVDLELWPKGPLLHSPRLRLEPLRVEHAEEMTALLDDQDLHRFIGGAPASLPSMSARYRRQALGRSADGSQRWVNWIVRRTADGQAVGTVQATVARENEVIVAEVAWVTATAFQGQGYAREAATVMVAWLRAQGAGTIVAHIHPDHRASAGVATAVGLSPTPMMEEGEIRWEG